MKSAKVYGVADRAWQCVVGCDPHMACAPRCWARKTTERIVECQSPVNPDRAAFFQIALTPDKKRWSGEVLLDETHLADPLRWRTSAVIATGFHGDWGRLGKQDQDSIFAVMGLAPYHLFLPLTKCPDQVVKYLHGSPFSYIRSLMDQPDWISLPTGRSFPRWPQSWPMVNVNIGCSVMNQAESDKYRDAMAQIAALGWSTHVWYEPALGPVNWAGWEFLRGVISGGESGKNSRPSHPQWHRDTRDWCARLGIPYNFKQWGCYRPLGDADMGSDDWDAPMVMEAKEKNTVRVALSGRVDDGNSEPTADQIGAWMMERVPKARAGRLLDGVTHDGVPAFGAPR